MPVGIRGVGLCCALGVDAPASVATLLAGGGAPHRVTLEGLADSVEAAYFRIADGAPLFDPGRFERLIPPVVQAAVAEAGLSAAERRALPVYLGSSCFSIGLSESSYEAALRQGATDASPMPHCGYGYLSELARRAAGSEGPTFTYNTACTSAANALLGAIRALASGRYPHALVLGAELANRTTLTGFAGLQLLAERVRPFVAERNGIVLGEGIGAVLLSAEPGAGEYLLHGGASNCDGFSVTTANPDGESVAAALRQALDSTGTAEVRGIRAHGTATPTGDMAEALGLRKVFRELPAISVLKPYLGHTLGACGLTELVLYLGALRQGALPAAEPGTPDPQLEVQVLDRQAEARPGRYLLNHFGFGGNNTVLVLEKP
ncbi:MAG TPA: beta-ketoacyl synthase N-terminal-like domain-containing protein [Gammaproteobacteria bacterium]|nr:beta-ketoacyl synthase N-terminal-like domain-containing protein [Gammaproteobacteria bacterium]